MKKRKLAEWKKEHKEHPWTTKAQAKRIARDHARVKKHSVNVPCWGCGACDTCKKGY